jgi:hypothetical protein
MARLSGLVVPIVAALAQLCAAALALGTPDMARTAAFLGGDLTMRGALAASELLVWLVILAILGWALALVLGEMRRPAAAALPPARTWELAVLVVGCVVLIAGGVHHFAGSGVQLGGGSVQEARSLAGG